MATDPASPNGAVRPQAWQRAEASAADESGSAIRWLAGERTRIREDAQGRLVVTVDGVSHEGATAAKLFALSEPEQFVSLADAQGAEIGILKQPGDLAAEDLRILRKHLERRYFIPVIQQVLRIQEYWIDQTWTVVTDRGQRQFTLQGRDSIRFLSDRAMLLMDMDDNRYLLEDRHALDPASRRWVERFVW